MLGTLQIIFCQVCCICYSSSLDLAADSYLYIYVLEYAEKLQIHTVRVYEWNNSKQSSTREIQYSLILISYFFVLMLPKMVFSL